MASKKKQSISANGTEAQLCKFQKFETRRMHRRDLKRFPRNPRTISPENRAWLERKLRTRGLLKGLVWNEATGNLVEGHQRLAVLDVLEGHDNYLLDIQVVRLTQEEEIEENIAFNGGRTGDWDMNVLGELLKTPELELDATGLEYADLQVMFDDPDLSTLFAPNEATVDLVSDVERQAQAAKDEAKKRKTAERREMLKREGGSSTDDTEVYAVALFKTREEREAFVQELGYGPDERYVDGERLVARLEAARSASPGPAPLPGAVAPSPVPSAAASGPSMGDEPPKAKCGRSRPPATPPG